MSLCISIMNENELYMSGDSRVAMQVEKNKNVKMHDNYYKLGKKVGFNKMEFLFEVGLGL